MKFLATMKNCICAFLSLSLSFGASLITIAQKFTIPVFPDTQNEVGGKKEMFFSQIKWIADKRDSLNVPIVLHVGDLVNFDNFNHYEIASSGYEVFDRHHIPYAIALGNHDTEAVGFASGSAAPGNVNQNLRKTAKFNAYFPTSRFTHQRGQYEREKSDNAYYTFKAGDTNWLIITLEFCPRLGAINWASDVAKRYFNYNVIVLTHYYLTSKGEIGPTNAGYGDFSPQEIFNRLVKPNPNVRFVLSGHVADSALKVDVRDQGDKVYQILQDYQGEDAGGGYIRLLDFDIEKRTVSASMYSPFYQSMKEDKSRFQLVDCDFIKQFEERANKKP